MQINQIATAAEQQTVTIGGIASNIQKITDVVQKTARSANETSSAAARLSTQSDELQRLIGQFKL